jgi:hypothetical protein
VSAVHHQSRPDRREGEARQAGRDYLLLAELDRWADAIIPMLLYASPPTRPLLPTNLSLLKAYLDARAGKAGAR